MTISTIVDSQNDEKLAVFMDHHYPLLPASILPHPSYGSFKNTNSNETVSWGKIFAKNISMKSIFMNTTETTNLNSSNYSNSLCIGNGHREVLSLSDDKLTATYGNNTAAFANRSGSEVASLRSSKPLKSFGRYQYYEATIIKCFSKSQLYIGLAGPNFSWTKNPGYFKNSYGYRSDDGKIVSEAKHLEKYGIALQQGDTLGCGFDRCTGEIFFALNGIYRGVAFDKISSDFYAAFSLRYPDESVHCNFGNVLPFKFDLSAFQVTEDSNLRDKILNKSIGLSIINQLVADHLFRSGYHASMRALIRDISPPTGNAEDHARSDIESDNRQKICELFMAGKCELAMECVKALKLNEDFMNSSNYSSLLPSVTALLFTQHWLDLLAKQPQKETVLQFFQLEFLPMMKSIIFSVSLSERDYIEKCLALVGFVNPLDCPLSWLFSVDQKQRIIDRLNAYLLLMFSAEISPALPKLQICLQQLSITLTILSNIARLPSQCLQSYYSSSTANTALTTSNSPSGMFPTSDSVRNINSFHGFESDRYFMGKLKSSLEDNPFISIIEKL